MADSNCNILWKSERVYRCHSFSQISLYVCARATHVCVRRLACVCAPHASVWVCACVRVFFFIIKSLSRFIWIWVCQYSTREQQHQQHNCDCVRYRRVRVFVCTWMATTLSFPSYLMVSPMPLCVNGMCEKWCHSCVRASQSVSQSNELTCVFVCARLCLCEFLSSSPHTKSELTHSNHGSILHTFGHRRVHTNTIVWARAYTHSHGRQRRRRRRHRIQSHFGLEPNNARVFACVGVCVCIWLNLSKSKTKCVLKPRAIQIKLIIVSNCIDYWCCCRWCRCRRRRCCCLVVCLCVFVCMCVCSGICISE